MIGLDTSFIIDFFKGGKNEENWMRENQDQVFICESVVYEFLCGDLSSNEVESFLAFVSQIQVFSFNRTAALKSAEIYRKAKKLGKTVSHPDVIIAGTYLANGVNSLITKNSKHFKNITSINLVKY